MIQYLLRLAKRFAILIPGIVIAYFSVRNIYPYFNDRLPVAVAILATYILAAYILIPGIIRLFRILHTPDHLPLYCVTPDGFASDPLNIGITGTRRELINAMADAGWYVADRHTFRNVARLAYSVIFDRAYLNAPVSNLYLFGRKQDIAFEIPVVGNASQRHHVRFWATTYDYRKKFSFKTIHWQHRKAHVYGDDLLWVGAASLDVGITLIRHNLQVTHMIDPDTDQERELIVAQMKKMKVANEVNTIKLDNPYKLANRVWRGSLHTDGKMKIIVLKRKPIKKQTKARRSYSRSN